MKEKDELAGINEEAIERIRSTADRLYSEGGRSAIPTVDTVRRAAQVDMNTTAKVMRAWRRSVNTVGAVTSNVPTKLVEAGSELLATVWNEAQSLAARDLQAARAEWADERTEMETIRTELAEAVDAAEARCAIADLAVADVGKQADVLRQEMQAAAEQLAALRSEIEGLSGELEATRAHLSAASSATHAAEARARAAEQRAEAAEARQHAGAAELVKVTAEASELRGELGGLRAGAVPQDASRKPEVVSGQQDKVTSKAKAPRRKGAD